MKSLRAESRELVCEARVAVLDSEVTGQEHMAYVSWSVVEGQECMLNTLRCG